MDEENTHAPQEERNRCYIPAHHSHEVSDGELLEQKDLYRYTRTKTNQPAGRNNNLRSRQWTADLKMAKRSKTDHDDDDDINKNHTLITNEPVDLLCVDSILHTNRRYLTDEGMALKKSYKRTVRKLDSDAVSSSVSSKSSASKDVVRSKNKRPAVKRSKNEEMKKHKSKKVDDGSTDSESKQKTIKKSPTPKKATKKRKNVKKSDRAQIENDSTISSINSSSMESTLKPRRKKRKSEELYSLTDKVMTNDGKKGKKTKKAKKSVKKKTKKNRKQASIIPEQ